MSVFDSLAEQRYQSWLDRISAPGYQPSPPVHRTATRTSYEGHVFSEVLRYLDKAGAARTPECRARFLEKARQLEVQLVILLERQKMPHVISTLRASIASHRREVLEQASSTHIRTRTQAVS
ncbi:MAG: hypothetical protein HKN42_09835 [Granulosicoccus sp.]|nr:hypothetical protein [Granulosicoccus sp.]